MVIDLGGFALGKTITIIKDGNYNSPLDCDIVDLDKVAEAAVALSDEWKVYDILVNGMNKEKIQQDIKIQEFKKYGLSKINFV